MTKSAARRMTTSYILWNILLGSLGLAYLAYAKVQRKIVPALGGIILLVIPYFTSLSWIYICTLVCVVILSYKLKY